MKKLQRIQDSLARIIFKETKYCHITPLRKQLHWLPVEFRIQFKQCLLVYKTLKTGVPSYFNSWLTPYSSTLNTRRSNPSNVLLKRVGFKPSIYKSKSHFDHSFAVSGPELWNSLPIHVRCSDSALSFRKKSKRPFLSTHY